MGLEPTANALTIICGICYYARSTHYSKSMDRPGNDANLARGQLNRNNVLELYYLPYRQVKCECCKMVDASRRHEYSETDEK